MKCKGHQEMDKYQAIILKHICLHFGMESLYLDIILKVIFKNADKVHSMLIFCSTVLFFFFTDVYTWYHSLK